MRHVEKLREDHAALVKLMRALGAVIEQPSPPPAVELYDLRRKLVSTLLAHLKSEDWVLYPRLMGSADAAIAATGRRFNEEMGGLSAAFVAYTDKWSATAITADWAGYCADTRGVLDALMGRITSENRELLPLLDRLEQAAA